MSLDGFFIHALVDEIRPQILGGRINKIYQPFDEELQFTIRNHRQNYRLTLSAHPTDFRFLLTDERPINPDQPPLFCMVMRKHIERAEITDLYQIQNDRIIVMELTGHNELGDRTYFHLMIELMGRHSNITLVEAESQIIVDAIKRVPPSINTYRSLLPNVEYRYPPFNEDQVNLWELSAEEVTLFAQENEEILRQGQTPKIVQGMSRQSANVIKYWLEEDQVSLGQVLNKWLDSFNHIQPTLIFQPSNERYYFYAFDLPQFQGDRKVLDSLSHLVEVYLKEKVTQDRIKQLSGSMIQRLNQLLKRNETKIVRLKEDREVAEGAEDYRLKGELLAAYAHSLDKGQDRVEVDNYYEPGQTVSIQLKPHLSPIENSQWYYKRYTKYRDSFKYIDRQLQLTRAEIDYLESVLTQLRHADLEDIESIREELQSEGYLKRQKRRGRRKQKKSRPRRFKASDGTTIYVGRNNQQNDDLSMRQANKNHWWLHTRNIPGAHVIIESADPSPEAFQEAAEIAAYYSKYHNSANVPVDTVQVKHLRKPNGAKPGFVIYEGQETLFVTPKAESIQAKEIK